MTTADWLLLAWSLALLVAGAHPNTDSAGDSLEGHSPAEHTNQNQWEGIDP